MSSSGSKKLFRPPTLSRHTPNFNKKKSDDDITQYDNVSKDSTPLLESQIKAKENHSHINLKKQSKYVEEKSLSNSQYDSLFDSVITQNETSNKTTELNSKQNSSQTNQEKQNKYEKTTFLSSLQYDESSSKISQNETSNETTQFNLEQNSSQTNQEKQKKCVKSNFWRSSKYDQLFSSEKNQNETSNETTELNAGQNSSQTNQEKQGKCVKQKSLSNSQYDRLFTSVITQNESNDETIELNTEKNTPQTNQEKQNKYVKQNSLSTSQYDKLFTSVITRNETNDGTTDLNTDKNSSQTNQEKQKSLSNSQYDRLFTSVIYGSQINCEDSEADVPKEHDAAIPVESAEHQKNSSKNQATKEKNNQKYTDTFLQKFNSVDLLKSDIKQSRKRWLTPAQKSDTKKSFDINEDVSRNSGKRSGIVPATRNMFKSPKKIKLTRPNSDCNSQSASSKFDSMSSRQSRGFPASQPPDNLNHRERLEWLQERRNVGVWVQCDHPTCKKWRYLCDTKDPIDVPKEWYCSLNPDKEMATCSAPEKGPTVIEEDDLVHNLYTAGSIVWAHLDGYPWWPAMVDDCPDTEQYYWLNELSDIPTHYNVTFFDSDTVTRAWVAPSDLKPYNADDSVAKFAKHRGKYTARIMAAEKQALDCKKLDMADRLKKYSFLSRWKGPIITPKDCIKRSAKSNRKTKMNSEKKSKIDTESLLEESLTNIFDSDDESDAIEQKTSQSSLNICKKNKLEKRQLRKLSQKENIQTQSQNIQEEIVRYDEESLNINLEKEQLRKSSQKEVCENIQTQSQNAQEEIVEHDEESLNISKKINLEKEQLRTSSQKKVCENIQTQSQNVQEEIVVHDEESLNISKKVNLEKEQLRTSSQKEVCEKIQTQSQSVQEEIVRHDEESKSANKENNLNESFTQFLEDSVTDLIQNSPILNSLPDAIFSTQNLDDDNVSSDCDLFEQDNTQSN